eukprot:885386-Amphidinium_carterae.1
MSQETPVSRRRLTVYGLAHGFVERSSTNSVANRQPQAPGLAASERMMRLRCVRNMGCAFAARRSMANSPHRSVRMLRVDGQGSCRKLRRSQTMCRLPEVGMV